MGRTASGVTGIRYSDPGDEVLVSSSPTWFENGYQTLSLRIIALPIGGRALRQSTSQQKRNPDRH
jgi:hypothetical protein